jgi:NAD(P)-dependent dehydrogenase (short-subunit alcohol dehydrogenase family)
MAYPLLSLEGRSAVVIGGTSGIGKLIALGFAQAGADVAATSRRESEVGATADELEKLGGGGARRSAKRPESEIPPSWW